MSDPTPSPEAEGSSEPTREAAEVTQILTAVEEDPSKAEELLPLVYNELRRLAQSRLAQDRPGQTLQATALVHEAYLRLVGSGSDNWRGKRHFFGAASLAMRRILIEAARRRLTEKRGGGLEPVAIDNIEVAVEMKDEEVLRINEALEKLEKEDEEAAEVVRLRFFVGLSHQEAADVLGTSARSARRIWTFARAWLFKEIGGG